MSDTASLTHCAGAHLSLRATCGRTLVGPARLPGLTIDSLQSALTFRADEPEPIGRHWPANWGRAQPVASPRGTAAASLRRLPPSTRAARLAAQAGPARRLTVTSRSATS